jgi:hypothetical protein
LYYKLEEGQDEERAARQQEAVCKDHLKDLYHEVHLQAVITYYADVLGQVVKKDRVKELILDRETNLTEEQYLQVIK